MAPEKILPLINSLRATAADGSKGHPEMPQGGRDGSLSRRFERALAHWRTGTVA